MNLDALIRYAITTRTSEIEGGNDSAAMLLYGDTLLDVLDAHLPEFVEGDGDKRAVCGSCIGSDEDLVEYPCRTVQAIARKLELIEPPAPQQREPRRWRFGEHTDIDRDVQHVIGSNTSTHYRRVPGTDFMWRGGNMGYGIATLLLDERELVEVVDARADR
jgi:hypothetical protein